MLIGLPLFGEVRTIKLPDGSEEIALHWKGERKLKGPNKALIESN